MGRKRVSQVSTFQALESEKERKKERESESDRDGHSSRTIQRDQYYKKLNTIKIPQIMFKMLPIIKATLQKLPSI